MSGPHPIETQTDKERPISSPTSNPTSPSSRRPTYDKSAFITEPWLCDEPLRAELPKDGDPWEKCLQKVKEFDVDICEGWRDEVDKLLIFAGLFFSAVTAFVIESYKFLQEDPEERNTFLLEQILFEMRNANAGLPPPTPVPIPPVFTPSASTIRINIVWFLSLSLSLGTVLLGILCLQWLREYQRNIPLDPKEALALRQMRYEGLLKWKVPQMLTSLPVLLNAALLLFFWGLLELLWSLNSVVAITTTIVVGTFTLIVCVTTILPTVQLFWIKDLRAPQCSWKSPQAWAVHRIIINLISLTDPHSNPLRGPSFRTSRYGPFLEDKNWFDYDANWLEKRQQPQLTPGGDPRPSDLVKALAWADNNLGRTFDMVTSIYHCIKALQPLASTVQTLSRISERIETHLTRNVISAHLTDHATPAVLAALYLEENNNAFPQLDDCRFETVIRALNTQLATMDADQAALSVPDSAHPATPSQRLPQLVFPFIRWPVSDARRLPLDILVQALQCVEITIQRGICQADHVESVVSFTGSVCSRLLDIFEDEGDVPPEVEVLKDLAHKVIIGLPMRYSHSLERCPEEWKRTQNLETRMRQTADKVSVTKFAEAESY